MSRRGRIVVVGWRGPRHPSAGGAEAYTVHALRGLVREGYEVAWLVPRPAGLPEREVVDGIEVVRFGWGVGRLASVARYLRSHQAAIDLVIDQVNGASMAIPGAFRGPNLLLIHHLVRGIWFRHLPWPAALGGYLAEPCLLLPHVRVPTVTVSASTEASLRRLGFEDVRIVPNAVQPPDWADRSVPRVPPTPARFVGLGRLVPAKRFEHLLDAFDVVRAELPDARLTLVGRGGGSYARRLAERVRATAGAHLLPNLDEDAKWRVLAQATAVVATSVREGWGLAISEGHAVGTPSVAYDVAGLRDSTVHEATGLVCVAEPAAAAEAMLRLARDANAWRRTSATALQAADRLTPERLGHAFAEVVESVLHVHGRTGGDDAAEAEGARARRRNAGPGRG